MVEEEQHPESEAERKSDANPFAIEFPESHQPRPIAGRHERMTRRKCGRIGRIEPTPVCHGGRGNQGDWHPIVLKEASYVTMEECCLCEGLEYEACSEHHEGEDDLYECTVSACRPKLAGKDLDAIL